MTSDILGKELTTWCDSIKSFEPDLVNRLKFMVEVVNNPEGFEPEDFESVIVSPYRFNQRWAT